MNEKMVGRESCLKYLVLIIYDVTDDKRRRKLVKYLEQYAVRIQYSAFQGYLTAAQYKKLCNQAGRFINAKTDSLRIYKNTENLKIKIWGRHTEEVLIF